MSAVKVFRGSIKDIYEVIISGILKVKGMTGKNIEVGGSSTLG